MTTTVDSPVREPVAVPELQHGDHIHLTPHDVYRHGDHPWRIRAVDADVEVDWVCYREHLIVIVIWHLPEHPERLGSTAYDRDDSVMRVEAAA